MDTTVVGSIEDFRMDFDIVIVDSRKINVKIVLSRAWFGDGVSGTRSHAENCIYQEKSFFKSQLFEYGNYKFCES